MAAPQYPVLFSRITLTTASQQLYAFAGTGYPSTATVRGIRLRFTNYTAAPVTITVYVVASGGHSVGSETDALDADVKLETVGAYSRLDIDFGPIGVGGSIRALAGANSSINASPLNGYIYS